MTPTEKAAQEAAEEIESMSIEWQTSYMPTAQSKKIILRHLAPLQAELDRKDNLLEEAKALLKSLHRLRCDCSRICNTCEHCRIKDWLARCAEE